MTEFVSTLGDLFLAWVVMFLLLGWIRGIDGVLVFLLPAIVPLAACITMTNQEERLRELGEGEQK
jgi:hypothetical protein